MLDWKKAPKDIVKSKTYWFKIPANFREEIINHFEPVYREDKGFRKCVIKLRKILYPAPLEDDLDLGDDLDKHDNEEMRDADPMKEDLFQQCMKEIDDYLHETKGCREMEWIDSQALTRHTPESLVQ